MVTILPHYFMQLLFSDIDADENPPTPRRNAPHLVTPDSGGTGGATGLKRKASFRRPPHRRRSSMNGQQPNVQVLSIPQLDAIQRTQKLLDVRLQHLQTQTDAYGLQAANQRVMDDIEHIRSLLSENQKAMFSIVKAVSTVQEEIHGLICNLGQWFSAQSELNKIKAEQSGRIQGDGARKSDDRRGDYKKIP